MKCNVLVQFSKLGELVIDLQAKFNELAERTQPIDRNGAHEQTRFQPHSSYRSLMVAPHAVPVPVSDPVAVAALVASRTTVEAALGFLD